MAVNVHILGVDAPDAEAARHMARAIREECPERKIMRIESHVTHSVLAEDQEGAQ